MFNSVDENEDRSFSNSIRSVSSELITEFIPLSQLENGCDGIEQQPSEIDAVIAAAEPTVNGTMENIQVEQASVDSVINSVLQDKNICKDDVKAPRLSNITTKSEPQKQEDKKDIINDGADTSKSTEIEIASKIPLFEQTIAKEIDSAIANAVKSVEIEAHTSSTNVSINGLKDEPIYGSTDNTVVDESIAAILPFFNADTIFTPTESGQTTPMKTSEREQAEEEIHAIVHEIMASVDKLFECVF